MRDREKDRNIRLPESYVQQGGAVYRMVLYVQQYQLTFLRILVL